MSFDVIHINKDGTEAVEDNTGRMLNCYCRIRRKEVTIWYWLPEDNNDLSIQDENNIPELVRVAALILTPKYYING